MRHAVSCIKYAFDVGEECNLLLLTVSARRLLEWMREQQNTAKTYTLRHASGLYCSDVYPLY